MTRFRPPIGFWLLLCLLLAWPAAAASNDYDLWYVLMLGDQRAGHAHVTMQEEDGKLVSDTDVRMSIRRGTMAMEITQASRFVETLDGKPIEASSEMKLGMMAVKQHMRFTDTGRELTSEQGGVQQQRTLPPIEGQWMTPGKMSREMDAAIARGEDHLKIRSVDLLTGPEPFVAEYRKQGEEPVEVFGRTVPATAWAVTMSVMPGITATQYLDTDGQLVRQSIQLMPGMDVVMLRADKQLALSDVTPPEIMVNTLVQPSRPIDDPREASSAVYRLSLKGGEAFEGIDLPRTGSQRVIWGDDRTATVVVDLTTPNEPAEDVPTDEHLKATSAMNHADPAVAALVQQVRDGLPADASDAQKAEAARRFVTQFMQKKDLSVGFATASEIARTRQGDCTEHGVLLAAILRGLGVPSRTVSGLVYVDEFLGHRGVFGYHLWTQAWIDGHWTDLDATLPADPPYDATHIALHVSALNDDAMMNDMVALVPTMGKLVIEVVSVE